MKKLFYLLIVTALVPLLLTSCRGDDPDPEVSEFELLTEYMVANNLDLSDILGKADDGTKWVKPKHKLTLDAEGAITGFTVIDIRDATTFAAGHIKDAQNSSLGNIITDAPADKTTKLLIVCKTGQTSARATAFLRMSGYNKSFSLKWGMSGWHSDFDLWTAGAKNLGHASWKMTGDETTKVSFDAPTITSSATTGEAIFNERITAALAKSDWIKPNTDVLDNPNNYFINNKWTLDAWTAYGHIDGAYRIDGSDLSIAHLDYLDPAENMITYCYTGQTSSITTAWLNVLGFDKAQSLKFGVNGIIYDEILAGVPIVSWKGAGSGSDVEDYIYVTD